MVDPTSYPSLASTDVGITPTSVLSLVDSVEGCLEHSPRDVVQATAAHVRGIVLFRVLVDAREALVFSAAVACAADRISEGKTVPCHLLLNHMFTTPIVNSSGYCTSTKRVQSIVFDRMFQTTFSTKKFYPEHRLRDDQGTPY